MKNKVVLILQMTFWVIKIEEDIVIYFLNIIYFLINAPPITNPISHLNLHTMNESNNHLKLLTSILGNPKFIQIRVKISV